MACGSRWESEVTDLGFKRGPAGECVERLQCVREGATYEVAVGDDDLVFVTIGSMTAASSLGSMTAPPVLRREPRHDPSWALVGDAGREASRFRPAGGLRRHVDRSKWLSFTVTLHDPIFFDLMERFTGNVAGTGGLVTFVDSRWLMSVVLAHQPHFIGQPDDVDVFWGYGLFVDREGDFVKKKMSDCSGEELLIELLGHLRFDEHKSRILTIVELHSLHDAVHHQPVHAEGQGRPSSGQAGRNRQPGFHRAILRDSRRCRVHGRIFRPLGADRGLFPARSR